MVWFEEESTSKIGLTALPLGSVLVLLRKFLFCYLRHRNAPIVAMEQKPAECGL